MPIGEKAGSDNGKPEQLPDNIALIDPYAGRIKHLMFTLGDIANPDPFSGLMDVGTVDDILARYYEAGYEPTEVFIGGFDTKGHRVGWVLQKSDEPKYKESHVVVQTLTQNPDPGRGTTTGFQADAYIGSFLDDGWDLLGVRFNGIDMNSGGVYLVWFLAR